MKVNTTMLHVHYFTHVHVFPSISFLLYSDPVYCIWKCTNHMILVKDVKHHIRCLSRSMLILFVKAIWWRVQQGFRMIWQDTIDQRRVLLYIHLVNNTGMVQFSICLILVLSWLFTHNSCTLSLTVSISMITLFRSFHMKVYTGLIVHACYTTWKWQILCMKKIEFSTDYNY